MPCGEEELQQDARAPWGQGLCPCRAHTSALLVAPRGTGNSSKRARSGEDAAEPPHCGDALVPECLYEGSICSAGPEVGMKTSNRRHQEHPSPPLWWELSHSFLVWTILGKSKTYCLTGAWWPALGEREPKDDSWSWSPENFVLPSQEAGTEGTPWSKRRAPRLTWKQVPVAYCWNTGIYGMKLVLLKSHIQIVLQADARVSKELNFMPLMRIVFPKGRSQNPSVQCNVLQ